MSKDLIEKLWDELKKMFYAKQRAMGPVSEEGLFDRWSKYQIEVINK